MSQQKTWEKWKAKGFLVTEAGDGLTLVYPSRGKHEWEADELAFRSALFDANGRLISVGWPKFFNQGEWAAHDAVIAGELASGRAVITHKHDGSLIIRSVLPDGRIRFRTRGAADGGEFAPLAEAVVREKYPALLDPAVYSDGSLLFEYVGAGNRIVVRYDGEDDLIFLGAATHDPVRYLPYAELRPLASALNLRLVEAYDWATGGIPAVLERVRDWDTAEGVVVRSADGQTLLKIKSAWYFAQHALRWNTTYESIVRFILDGGIDDEAQFRHALTQAGWDYETTKTAEGYFQRYAAARAEVERIKSEAFAFVAAFDAETAGVFTKETNETDEKARRKAFAARIFGPDAKILRERAPLLFLAYDGRTPELDAVLLRKIILKG